MCAGYPGQRIEPIEFPIDGCRTSNSSGYLDFAMKITAGVIFDKPHASQKLPLGCDRTAMSVPVEDDEADRRMDLLASEPGDIRVCSLDCRMMHSEWMNPDPIVIGAVLGGEDLARLSPQNEFNPSWPGVIMGRVPEASPLILLNRPSGLIAHASDELVMRPRIASFFEIAEVRE